MKRATTAAIELLGFRHSPQSTLGAKLYSAAANEDNPAAIQQMLSSIEDDKEAMKALLNDRSTITGLSALHVAVVHVCDCCCVLNVVTDWLALSFFSCCCRCVHGKRITL